MQMYCTAEMLNRITTYRRKSLNGVQLLLLHTLMRVGMSSFIKTNKQKKKRVKKKERAKASAIRGKIHLHQQLELQLFWASLN